MTRMQILAKTTLTVLGIYAVLTLCNAYPGGFIYRREPPALVPATLSLSGLAVLAAVTIFFLIFNNTEFSKRIAGPGGEILRPRTQRALLVKSLRAGLLVAGLMLLPRSMPTIAKILKIFFLVRPALNDIIISKSAPDMLKLSYPEWFRNIYGFFRAILALYLIYGAPHFIRWQVRHSVRQEPNSEQTAPPKYTITNSERGEHE